MQLNAKQIEEYRETGCLLFPGLFRPQEIGQLQSALPQLLGRRDDVAVYEKDGSDALRLVYGAHALEEAYRRMSRHPRLLEPVRQLLEDEAYIHQTRLNPKMGFHGGEWTWHQDFGTWHRADGMPEPRCVMTAVFLDDISAVNSPLLIIPGSQHHGMREEVKPEDGAVGYVVMEIDKSTVTALADDSPIRALEGPAGSVAFLHCNIVHGSAPNISPYRRAIWYVNYSAVGNAATGSERPWYQNNRDFTALTSLDDDCLRDLSAQAAAE
ncbi:phytanoyl-CoA dioxygenase family protein [Algihabitans albus]|uniref:phytanoyl-CoA dioxygenase family protein n=1 Tax=Algihabitans albus TaxID=2164067 RepID=UPI0035CFC6A4